jgi:hypothetical protein
LHIVLQRAGKAPLEFGQVGREDRLAPAIERGDLVVRAPGDRLEGGADIVDALPVEIDEPDHVGRLAGEQAEAALALSEGGGSALELHRRIAEGAGQEIGLTKRRAHQRDIAPLPERHGEPGELMDGTRHSPRQRIGRSQR